MSFELFVCFEELEKFRFSLFSDGIVVVWDELNSWVMLLEARYVVGWAESKR